MNAMEKLKLTKELRALIDAIRDQKGMEKLSSAKRLRELSFNSTFLREMRSFAHLREQISPSRLPGWLLGAVAPGALLGGLGRK